MGATSAVAARLGRRWFAKPGLPRRTTRVFRVRRGRRPWFCRLPPSHSRRVVRLTTVEAVEASETAVEEANEMAVEDTSEMAVEEVAVPRSTVEGAEARPLTTAAVPTEVASTRVAVVAAPVRSWWGAGGRLRGLA